MALTRALPSPLAAATAGLLLALAWSSGSAGEEAAAAKPRRRLDETIVTATRHDLRIFDAPYTASRIDGEDIRGRRLSRTTPEIFAEDPSILVQKTGVGQGSPFLRGFTGFRTLFLIDGIRLNNSVFRDGPNQYWNTVDPFSIGRLEVVKGPSSVLYGSDAIGGTVNAITRSRLRLPKGFGLNGRIYYRFASADHSSMGRLELEGNVDKTLAFFLGLSLKDFNDLYGGHGVRRQHRTGYDQRDGDAKIEYFPDEFSKVVLAYQRVHVDDAWRAHKTVFGSGWHGTAIGSERERVLDQDRQLAYIQYHTKNVGSFFDSASVSLSYQLQQEERDRTKGDHTRDRQGFDVGTWGFWTTLQSDTPAGLLTYGLEYYHDTVNSFKKKYTAEGKYDSKDIQGPVADDATYDLFGLFLQDEFPVTSRLDATVGVRYTRAEADADDVKDPVTGEEMGLSDHWDNVVGSARLLYHVSETVNLFGGVSQGFRAPNLSDLTRLDTARSGEIETPSPGLDPEKFVAYEIGVKTQTDRWHAQVSCFYTDIRDLIVRFPTGRTVEGDAEIQKANVGDGYVHGIEVQSEYELGPQWTVFGALAFQRGRVDTYPTSAMEKERKDMSRIAPLSAVTGARWRGPAGRWWAEGLVRMADEQDHLSPRDKLDTQRIPLGGTPGYGVADLRAGYKLTDGLRICVAVQNLLNKSYRIHGSGQNEPGRSFLLAADWRF